VKPDQNTRRGGPQQDTEVKTNALWPGGLKATSTFLLGDEKKWPGGEKIGSSVGKEEVKENKKKKNGFCHQKTTLLWNYLRKITKMKHRSGKRGDGGLKLKLGRLGK